MTTPQIVFLTDVPTYDLQARCHFTVQYFLTHMMGIHSLVKFGLVQLVNKSAVLCGNNCAQPRYLIFIMLLEARVCNYERPMLFWSSENDCVLSSLGEQRRLSRRSVHPYLVNCDGGTTADPRRGCKLKGVSGRGNS
eukprot:TRINITY_DN564_c0_g1_i5.p2 TRINITY_DN564_c0_g1~~TRINITY_DN564_c0_g1_i5.p2  ORF type:complete len:137 (-),score=10.39 TRINITY_DN564_c0_g1_i5:221-631(-)